MIKAVFLFFGFVFSFTAVNANCIGNNYEQIIGAGKSRLPEVVINSPAEGVVNLAFDKKISLSADLQLDEAQKTSPFYYWCSEQALLSPDESAPDFSAIKFTVPQGLSSVNISVQAGDGLGYIATDSISLSTQNADLPQEENPETPAAEIELFSPRIINPQNGETSAALDLNQGLTLQWSEGGSSATHYLVQMRPKPQHAFVEAFSDNCNDFDSDCMVNKEITNTSLNLPFGVLEYEKDYIWRVQAIKRDENGAKEAQSDFNVASFTVQKEPEKAFVRNVGLVDFTKEGDPILLITIEAIPLLGGSILGDINASEKKAIEVNSDTFTLISDAITREVKTDDDGFSLNAVYSYRVPVKFKDADTLSANLNLKLTTNDGLTTERSIFIDNDLARFKNIEEGFNILNDIDIKDDFNLDKIHAHRGLDGDIHLLTFKSKDEIDVQANKRFVENKIIYLKLDTKTNQFSFPKIVHFDTQFSEEDLNGFHALPEVLDAKIAVDSNGTRHIVYSEKNAKGTRERIYYLSDNLETGLKKELIDDAASIAGFDLEVIKNANTENLVISYALADEQRLNEITKVIITDAHKPKFINRKVFNDGQINFPLIRRDGDELIIFTLNDFILHSNKIALSKITEPNFGVPPAWILGANWATQQVLPEFIDHRYDVEMGNFGSMHVSWMNQDQLRYWNPAHSDIYWIINPDQDTFKIKVFDFELDEKKKAQYVSTSNDAKLIYNFKKGTQFYGPSVIGSNAIEPSTTPRFIIGDNGTRYIFYKSKDPNDNIGLLRAAVMIIPALSDAVDHNSAATPKLTQPVETHPNALSCDENFEPSELVCGEDGIEYPSECHARKNFTSVKNTGSCVTEAELLSERREEFNHTTLGELSGIKNFSYSFFFKMDDFDNRVLLEAPFRAPHRDFYQKLELRSNAEATRQCLRDDRNCQAMARRDDGTSLRFSARAENGLVQCSSQRIIYPEERHHVAIVYDAQKGMQLYVNGLKECSADYKGPLERLYSPMLGRTYGPDFENVDAHVTFDNLKTFKFGLTEDEVKEIYSEVEDVEASEPHYDMDPLLDIDFENALYNDREHSFTVFDNSKNHIGLINDYESYSIGRQRVYDNGLDILEANSNHYALRTHDNERLKLRLKETGYIKFKENTLSVSSWIKPKSLNVTRNDSDENLIESSAINLGLGKCQMRSDLELITLKLKQPYLDWTHTACVFNGSELIMYVNGELKDRAKVNADISNRSAEIKINAALALDDIKVYAKVLELNEINQLFNLKKSLVRDFNNDIRDIHSGLSAYYSFDEIESKTDGSLDFYTDHVNAQNINIKRHVYSNDNYMNKVTEVDGVLGTAALFGHGRYVAEIENTAKLALNNRYSISFFMKGAFNVGNILGRGRGSDEQLTISSSVDTRSGSSGYEILFSSSSDDNRDERFSIKARGSIFDSSDWRMVTMTYDGSKAKIYIDGELNNEADVPSLNFANHGNQKIVFKDSLVDWYDSSTFSLDELRFYNRALSDEDVKDLARFYVATQFKRSCEKDSSCKAESEEDLDITMDDMGVFSVFTKSHDLGAGASSSFYYNDDGLNINAHNGGAYVLKSFDKDYLESVAKVRLHLSSMSSTKSLKVQLLDGYYDINNPNDFPKGFFSYKGAGLLQDLANIHDQGDFKNTITIVKDLDLTKSKLNQVTLLINATNYGSGTHQALLNGIELLDANNRVIAIMDKSHPRGSANNAEIGSDAKRSVAKPESVRKFNLELREHEYQRASSSRYRTDVNFNKYYDRNLGATLLQLSSNRYSMAQGFIFKSFKKSDLKGAKANIIWKAQACPEDDSYKRSNLSIELHEGKISRKLDKYFREEREEFTDPIQVLDSTNATYDDLKSLSKELKIEGDPDDYVTLMFKANDFSGSCAASIFIKEVKLVNAYDETFAEFDIDPALIQERRGSYKDYASIGQDDFAPPPIKAKKFNLELREHRHHGSSRYRAETSFSSRASSYLKIESSRSAIGSGYAFETFDKEFLNGKKIRVVWEPKNSSSRSRNLFSLKIMNGAYTAANDSIFKESDDIKYPVRRYPVLKTIAYTTDSQSKTTVESDIIDLNSHPYAQDKVTLMLQLYDSSSSYASELRLYALEIIDEEGRAVAQFDMSSPIQMQRTRTYGDYGFIGETEL